MKNIFLIPETRRDSKEKALFNVNSCYPCKNNPQSLSLYSVYDFLSNNGWCLLQFFT